MPASALQAHEEAWNAYPYTKTRYSCPFIDRFVIEVETRYFNDAGTRENVFGLNKAEIKQRVVGAFIAARHIHIHADLKYHTNSPPCYDTNFSVNNNGPRGKTVASLYLERNLSEEVSEAWEAILLLTRQFGR